MQLTLSDIEKAWASKDPALVDYIITLASQPDPVPDKPIRSEALTFQKFLNTIFSPSFLAKPTEEQQAWRVEQIRLLEAEDAELPLAERLKLHKIILLLWTDKSLYARHVLLEVITKIPLVYGPWRALKHIFKAAEASNDYPLLGALAARCDMAIKPEFSRATLLYMRRRAWRYLRQLGQTLPVVYPEAASHFLAAYTDDTHWQQTWIAKHIFYHETHAYGSAQFGYISPKTNLLDKRAFKEAWQRSPEPLLRLLSMARAEPIRKFACDALKTDFAVILRDVEVQWLIDLAHLPVRSTVIDNFIVWLLQNSPKLEQQQFRKLGLHTIVIGLLESQDSEALNYAIHYVKAQARDLPVSELLRLALKPNADLAKLVRQLISERDPRRELGLEAWGQLLALPNYYEFAEEALRKHFGRKELSTEWFQPLLLSSSAGLKFAKKYLLEWHPLKTLGTAYFQGILEQLDTNNDEHREVADFALTQLVQLELKELSTEFIQTALFHPFLTWKFREWLQNDLIKTRQLPLDFYQALAYEVDWYAHPFIQNLRQSNLPWTKYLSFDASLAEQVRSWLLDVRRFSPTDMGFEWLMKLVNREEVAYHDFAVKLMIKAFTPADFAPTQAASSAMSETLANDKAIDLEQKTFLFTGKLSTMTRGEAEAKVTAANGKNAGSVNAKLAYLVIGDEGSPLYGNGRKGSKQVSAEKLIADGASIKIISETAFLQMLAGEQREFSEDTSLEGCKTLWSMAVDKPDTPISKFAIHYLRYHHPELCLKLTDRPVDPGSEIPHSFATFKQFKPLFNHANPPLRNLALDYAQYEFVRWNPSVADLIVLTESKYSDVREFVSKALTEEANQENRRYRLDASLLPASEVYSFCETRSAHTRQLGMQLIQQYEKFQLPEALFQLTESPDRELRSFVVRILWALYRRYSTTAHWKPSLPVMANLSSLDHAKREAALKKLGSGLPKHPDNLPADHASLQQLLRRWLYELPPGRMSTERLKTRLKPLSASQAKKALIETFRDVALEDVEFAQLVLPLFKNFTRSKGRMEQAACLVAVIRLQTTHPALAV
ncbi:BRCT domain-containing protein [uncultured Thiothrix sp.]|uniref:BRCT domain-containing protein n=1 Tax=uncultured Thiothrix sp. TaxID=223185 RepID=UPI002607208B|nr:BRCT domain-containing protein [uncultured Thiothrix sp.]HMT91710.1 BRCT domain-containing protein [Thiolinea sp.]